MVRWQPGASDRLRAAALELFADQGFDATTAAEIAARAGVTERTFFRHFEDKREVLFAGQESFQQGFLDGVVAAPTGLTALEVVASALDAAATAYFSEERRTGSRLRGAVISAHPALQERELLKLAALAGAMAAALRERGVTEPAATLAAESGVTVFRIAFAQWLDPGEQRSLTELERKVLADLTTLTGPSH